MGLGGDWRYRHENSQSCRSLQTDIDHSILRPVRSTNLMDLKSSTHNGWPASEKAV